MKLGFHQPLTRLYIFIKNEANCLWYWLDDGRQVYIPDTALTGTLKSFEVKQCETSYGDLLKADFEIVADRRYVLRSGADSAFSRGMLLAIAALSDKQLKRPITIEVKPGQEKSNVLVSVRDPKSFEPIITGKWENVNWDDLTKSAIARLGGLQPQPQQPTINQKQYQDLLARSKQVGYTSSGFAQLIAKFGFSRGSEIFQEAYPQLWAEVCDLNMALLMNAKSQPVTTD